MKKSFLTEANYQLAGYEIKMPTGPYNTEFQEAKARLGSVTDELKSTQTEYDARMKELDGRETELERKKAELLRR